MAEAAPQGPRHLSSDPAPVDNSSVQPIMNDKTYNVLKALAQYILPAVSAFYVALAVLWGFPFVEKVVGSIAATEVLLGALMGLAAHKYNQSDAKYDGNLVVDTTGPKDLYSLEVTTPLEAVKNQDSLVLKVAPPA